MVARLGQKAAGRGQHTLWCGEVDDVSVRLEHVDLLNGLDWLDVHLLENGLELLLINARVLWLGLDLASWGSLSAIISSLSASHPSNWPLSSFPQYACGRPFQSPYKVPLRYSFRLVVYFRGGVVILLTLRKMC